MVVVEDEKVILVLSSEARCPYAPLWRLTILGPPPRRTGTETPRPRQGELDVCHVHKDLFVENVTPMGIAVIAENRIPRDWARDGA
jgi:hypothetical protein